jgi:hypothetical protein
MNNPEPAGDAIEKAARDLMELLDKKGNDCTDAEATLAGDIQDYFLRLRLQKQFERERLGINE